MFLTGNLQEEEDGDEEVPGAVSTEEGEGSGASAITSSDNNSTIHKKLRGGGKGRNAAVKQKIKDEEMRKKR